ncbi:MAG: HD domain-containing protein [Thermodesulfobacteriota bacterium]
MSLDEAAAVVRRLRGAGHEAYLVGGCVRDMLRGAMPEDFDIVTSARPEQVRTLFARTVPIGARFGVVLVVEKGRTYEVAAFRSETDYVDGRRPSRVAYATAEEDVRRRDFTVNGLLMDPETGRVIDYVDGRRDIEGRLIRTIGDPMERFAEDHLRMIRAVRFTAVLDYAIDPATLAAIRRQAPGVRRISAERIREELRRIITSRGARKGMELLAESGLLAEILPEVLALRGVAQPAGFHPEGDVWEHTLRMLALLPDVDGGAPPRRKALEAPSPEGRPGDLSGHPGPPAEHPRGGLAGSETPVPSAERNRSCLAWAVLLHDIGKAVTRSEDESGIHFYGHVQRGGEIAAAILRRLRFSLEETETILALVRGHMLFMDVQKMRPSRLKRFLRQPDFPLHLELHRLDCLASHGLLDHHRFCLGKLEAYSGAELRPAPLLTGKDLIRMGYRPGPLFREILLALEEAQLNGEVTDAEEARRLVQRGWGGRDGNT